MDSTPLREPLAPVSANDNVKSVDDLAPLMAQKLHISEDTYVDEEDDRPNMVNEKVDWEKERKEMDQLFEQQAKEQLEGLDEFSKPSRFKKSLSVFRHQEDGIRWLVQQEKDPRPNPFVRRRVLKSGTEAMYDRLTKGRIQKEHPPTQGSILADEMGLGKTLQTIGLILSNPPADHRYGIDDATELEDPICTLIVCPKTVISNWLDQIERFVKRDTFRIKTYTGTPKQRSKTMDLVMENEVDILLSSYETITAEFEKERKGMESIHDAAFWRVVIDESHNIRNPKSKCYKAICSVASNSKYRLALTGTPFVNNPMDIHSLLSFIGLQPLADADMFKAFVDVPIKNRKRAGLTRLRAALAYVAMRRTKNVVEGITMVDKTINIQHVEWEEGEHKMIHDCLYVAAKNAFQASINGFGKEHTDSEEGVGRVAQQAMFSMLLRVRQSCASGDLVAAAQYERAQEVVKDLVDDNGEDRELTAKEGNRMLEKLQSTDPNDNRRLRVGVDSPKISALLSAIKDMDSDEKGVIFSQWTSFLDIIEYALDKAGHQYVRIDGSMSVEQRTVAIQRLNNDNEVRFILCSLKSSGVGINLTRANIVFMMDPWWNDATEMQAIDRVHRMGQTRPVRVFRLVMKDSIEERMLNVQKKKATMAKGTMKKLSAAEEKIAQMTGLKDLFQIEDSNGNDGWE